jgi:hypothetical protein
VSVTALGLMGEGWRMKGKETGGVGDGGGERDQREKEKRERGQVEGREGQPKTRHWGGIFIPALGSEGFWHFFPNIDFFLFRGAPKEKKNETGVYLADGQ